MNPADLPLKDIHLPPPPPWWPPAPGWWVLLALACAALVALFFYVRHRRRTRMRRAALSELAAIARRHAGGDAHALAADISMLLRRIALGVVPRPEAAGVTGRDWIALLERIAPDAPLDAATRDLILDAPYRRTARIDAQALVDACERWMRALPALPVRGGTR
jgi:hypothetical protein